MSQIFGNNQSMPGCFVKARNPGSVEGARFTLGDSPIENSVVTRFSMNKGDDFIPVKCLGDLAYINVFGKQPATEASITVTLFMIKGGEHTDVFDNCTKQFDSVRLSSDSRKPCDLTVGSKVIMSGFATALAIGADSSNIGLGDATITVVSTDYR